MGKLPSSAMLKLGNKFVDFLFDFLDRKPFLNRVCS